MDRQKQIIIGAGITLAALIGYAIYTDLSRLFPPKDNKDKKK